MLAGPGQELDDRTRAGFEPRFAHDFSGVRVHTGGEAARSALAVGARAYTVGRHIVFGRGEFAPGSPAGDTLLAHELAHVVQQARSGELVLSRATLRMGSVSADINYGDVINVAAADYVTTIQSRFLAYAGAALAPAVVAQITAFTPAQQSWVLFALDLLADNTVQVPGLAKATAFSRAVDRAPTSATTALGSANQAFEREVLTVSGWFEEALSRGLTAPGPTDQLVIDPILNPPAAASAPPGGVFDAATFNTELPILTRAKLAASSLDPANWPAGTAAQPIAQVQSVGDVIQDRARTFFSPFSTTARDNRWLEGWQYSANIHSVTTDAAGNPAPVTAFDRTQLLNNRAQGAGRDSSSGPSLFSRTNFDTQRDGAAFDAVVAALDADPAVQAMVERQFRHTGHLERPSLQVAISTEVNAAPTECATRWSTIRTLCHELMHSLAHPDFVAATTSTPRFPSGVDHPQVLVEGCAEVLGVQLFNDLRVSAVTNAALRTSLSQGLTGSCTPPGAVATPGYRDAGSGAETIRQQVGDERFRAAYFYGRVALMGL